MAEAAVDHVQIAICTHDHPAAPQPPAAGKVNRSTDRVQAHRIDPFEPSGGGIIQPPMWWAFIGTECRTALQVQLALLALDEQHRPAAGVANSRSQSLARPHPWPGRGNQLLSPRAAALSRPRRGKISVQPASTVKLAHGATLSRSRTAASLATGRSSAALAGSEGCS